jgi:hypothetical protein
MALTPAAARLSKTAPAFDHWIKSPASMRAPVFLQ